MVARITSGATPAGALYYNKDKIDRGEGRFLVAFNTPMRVTDERYFDIREALRGRRCVVLGTSKPEIDHKNGWKNDVRVMTPATQRLEDFQPLSKAANDAKRQFCKECRKTGKRFDARRLGYPVGWYAGGEAHVGDTDGCIGCFWYDPIEFRRHLKFEP